MEDARAPDDNPICCRSRDELFAQRARIVEIIEASGYCIIQTWGTDASVLIELVRHFGNIQRHARADELGVVEICCHADVNDLDKTQYVGLSNARFPPHTDGAYLSGIGNKDGVIGKIGPPKLVALQCVQPAVDGGENVLIDGKRLMIDIITREPETARTLLRYGSVSFCRDDQLALNQAIFEYLEDRTWQLRFRFDQTTYLRPWSLAAVLHFEKEYVSSEKYVHHLILGPGQILLIDNLRCLHGREAFGSDSRNRERHFRRAWVHDERTDTLITVTPNSVPRRALDRFRSYEKVADSESMIQKLRCGISLSQELHLRTMALLGFLPAWTKMAMVSES